MKFLCHIVGKEGLKGLILTGYTGGKRKRGKQHITYLAKKWMVEQCLGGMTEGQDLLGAAGDGRVWRVVIANILKRHSTLKKLFHTFL